ncbi:glycosyltransferase family 39 protein [uncultured Paludibaculum sp.]|uniref:ArnT family glycosyltransferase n=1 Tax=uncultured Paludibaculum sp. TaxID=1765020 RepID=UPI002AAA8E48|nr:glycosyltransferase family 39 protein [uncultured Paludibaculum sp.]
MLLLFFAVITAFYGVALGQVGLLSADEPRYASIGREMARSGDWITPRLWGDPWFEKPPLLYWLVAAGQRAGLGDDLSPRLPVTLLSLAYLLLQFLVLRRLEGERIAWIALLLLATTAGWAAESQIGVTDLPLAATFNASLLLGLLWLETGSKRAALAAGACFGLSLLAKGLVAGVLILPFFVFAWKRWKELLAPAAAALLVAAPWYGAMFVVHGRPFWDEFFVKHHFSRFADGALLHTQPFWFYVPVLVASLFPWPTVLTLIGPACWSERRRRLLASVFCFGFVFFSASANKLPGYILPLLPSLCIVLAAGIETAGRALRQLALAALLLGLCPIIATVLPDALLHGLRRANLGEVHWEYFAMALPFVLGVWWFERTNNRVAAVAVVALGSAAGLLFVKLSAAPVLDHIVSARGLWRRVEPRADQTCVESLHRNWLYGLNYYSVQPLPGCAGSSRAVSITQKPGAMPSLSPRSMPMTK